MAAAGAPAACLSGGRRTLRPRSAVRAGLSVAVAVFAGLLAYSLLVKSPGAAPVGKAQPAPAFTLPLLNAGRLGSRFPRRLVTGLADGRLELAELRGVPVMLNVWASWCPTCREEAPVLERAWREDLRPRGVLLMGLDIRDVLEDARDFLRAFRIDYPNVRDEFGKVARRYGATSIPQMFLISRSGRVIERVVGTVSRQELRGQATKLLRTP